MILGTLRDLIRELDSKEVVRFDDYLRFWAEKKKKKRFGDLFCALKLADLMVEFEIKLFGLNKIFVEKLELDHFLGNKYMRVVCRWLVGCG